MSYKKEIEDLGTKMVECDECKKFNKNNCINTLNQKEGIIPRGMIFTEDPKYIVISINPGTGRKNDEREEYKKNPSYNSIKKYTLEHMNEINYFIRIKDKFSKKLKLDEEYIYWTDFIKCESRKAPKYKTNKIIFEKCIDKFLKNELDILDNCKLIFLFGNVKDVPLKNLYVQLKNRKVICFYHPSSRCPPNEKVSYFDKMLNLLDLEKINKLENGKKLIIRFKKSNFSVLEYTEKEIKLDE